MEEAQMEDNERVVRNNLAMSHFNPFTQEEIDAVVNHMAHGGWFRHKDGGKLVNVMSYEKMADIITFTPDEERRYQTSLGDFMRNFRPIGIRPKLSWMREW